MSTPIIRTWLEGEKFGIPGIEIVVKVSSEETGGALAVFEETTSPGGGPPLHIHEKQWETFRFLEGTYKLKVGDRSLVVEPGTVAVVPPGTPHAFLNVGSGPARVEFSFSPGLKAEEFFKKLIEMIKETGDFSKVDSLAKQYHVKYIGGQLTP